ncbi:hypothetical protein [Bacillus sp. NPDC077027]|uniref:hypothetical protein n=1 Tax=Bacillus sp. NPDC077027 TaxID=3390548 RepID=UPI003D086CBF
MKKWFSVMLTVVLGTVGFFTISTEPVHALDGQASVQNNLNLKVSTDRSAYSPLQSQVKVKLESNTNEQFYYTAGIRKLTFPVTHVFTQQGTLGTQTEFTAPVSTLLPPSGTVNYDVHVSVYKDASRSTLVGYYVSNPFSVSR